MFSSTATTTQSTDQGELDIEPEPEDDWFRIAPESKQWTTGAYSGPSLSPYVMAITVPYSNRGLNMSLRTTGFGGARQDATRDGCWAFLFASLLGCHRSLKLYEWALGLPRFFDSGNAPCGIRASHAISLRKVDARLASRRPARDRMTRAVELIKIHAQCLHQDEVFILQGIFVHSNIC